jgi:hypothetical protein
MKPDLETMNTTFLEFKQQQLEDEGLLKAMQETKDHETIDLVNAKLCLGR